jgi:hypothetical protein
MRRRLATTIIAIALIGMTPMTAITTMGYIRSASGIAMSITRDDVFKCCQVTYKAALEAQQAQHTMLISKTAPQSVDLVTKYEQARDNYKNLRSVYYSWCDVLTKIDSGVDPTIAVLERQDDPFAC